MEAFLDSESSKKIKEDYKELTLLSLFFLGGTRLGGITIIAPGAYHHARWMAAILYTLKISLFREQLLELNIFEASILDMVDILGIFLVLFYVKYWLCCTSPSDAPSIDLNLLKLFEKASVEVEDKQMQDLVNLSKQKLISHLWYLSERLVPFAFFSSRVSNKDKAEIAKEIIKYKTNATIQYTQDMPISNNFCSKKLKNFIGPDSWTFFLDYLM